VDLDNPGTVTNRSGLPVPVPRITGRIRRRHAVEVDDLLFLKANTTRAGEDHRARPLHHELPGAERLLPQRRSRGHGLRQALNEEIRDLFAAGADVVQIDEPWMQAQPEKARQYGLKALNAALDGITGTTAVHICFGYAAMVAQRPSGYSFLPELRGCGCKQVSVETAQSHLDCSVLAQLDDKQVMVGCIDLSDPAVESPQVIADRVRRALPYVAPGARHPGARLRHEVPAARHGDGQAAGHGAGRPAAARRARRALKRPRPTGRDGALGWPP
jgi:5-methyltetrahydropteroyltriglutamate--homocysteine methyltransferase